MISLRPATDRDRDFLLSVFAASRMPDPAQRSARSVERDFADQLHHYRTIVPAADLAIVEADGVPIGRLCVQRRRSELRLLDIALLPEQRGHGVGTRLIATVLAEARRTGQPVCCDVERWNLRARALYERLGFREVFADPVCTAMTWVPEDEPAAGR